MGGGGGGEEGEKEGRGQLVCLYGTRLLWYSAGKCEEIRPFYMLHVL